MEKSLFAHITEARNALFDFLLASTFIIYPKKLLIRY